MNYSEQQLIDGFIKTIPIRSNNTKKLFAIGFIGPTGSGKTFVAKKISEKLNFYIASNDEVKRFLNNMGFEGLRPAPEILNKISVEVLNYLFKNRTSHIIDADLIIYHKSATQIAESYGAKVYFIEIKCSEEIAIQRIKTRQRNIELNKEDNFSRGTIEDYYERIELHKTLEKPDIFFSIDTELDIDNQIDNLIFKLKQEEII